MLDTYFSHIKKNLEIKVFFIFSIAFFIVFQSLSYFSLWIETEIYPVHSVKYLFTENHFEFLFSLKPIFYLLLYVSHLFSDLFSLLPMDIARFLFALNGLLILLLMYLYLKQKTNKYNALLAILLFASTNIFLDRAFRIRSDLLCSSMSLLILLMNLNLKHLKETMKFSILISLLFSLLLISPKGIYWLCFTLCLMIYDLKDKKFPSWILFNALFAIGLSLFFLSFFLEDPWFLKAIKESFYFYFLSLKEIWINVFNQGLIKTLSTISHISFFIERNFFLLFIILLKVLFIIKSIWISKKRKGNLSDIYFLILLFIFLFHPQQKLFFFCALMPFFLISFFTDFQWKQLNHHYSLQFKTFLLAGAFLYSFSYISYFSYKIYNKKNNQEQKKFIRNINHFYKNTNPLISIFDPTCLIYSRKTKCKYILYSTYFYTHFPSYLKQNHFDIVLASKTLDRRNLLNYKQSSFQYINIQNHIYYKAFILDLKKKKERRKIHFIRGKDLLKKISDTLEIKIPEKSKMYSYTYFDSQSQPITKKVDCRKSSRFLQKICPYNKEEFSKGLIPIEEKKLALFYLPFPSHLAKDQALTTLFQYDLY